MAGFDDFDFSNIKKLIIKNFPNGKVKSVGTDGTQADADAALKVLAIMAGQVHTAPQNSQHNLKSICLRDVIDEYLKSLTAPQKTKSILSGEKAKSLAKKSLTMARSTLKSVCEVLGADFDMSGFCIEALEPWAQLRAEFVANNTIRRDLSFIVGFFNFCAAPERKYCAKIQNNMKKETDESWLPFERDNLELIFSNLPASYSKNWQFWIPLIGLYTGGRISEITALRVEHFKKIMGIDVFHLPGTKTDASPRDLLIHQDLIEIGLLDLVEKRKNEGKTRLFDIKDSPSNGAGARPSKDFTELTRQKLKISNDRKVFHSFRHLITRHLIQVSCEGVANTQFTGHSLGKNIKFNTYVEPINIKTLKKETINKMDWAKF